MKGRIHIYCGDGKGKTTAAVGLAVRAAGADMKVLFAQFFKNGKSSEVASLKQLHNIKTLHCQTVPGRFKNMTPEQQVQAQHDYSIFLADILEQAENFDLLVLDEVISACNHGVIPETVLLDFLFDKPGDLEVVLTGRNPSEKLLETADYITEMKKIRHPFDKGTGAKRGIEF